MMTIMADMPPPVKSLLRRVAEEARPRRVRSMIDFAEQEFVIPDGVYEGRPFKVARQPVHGVGVLLAHCSTRPHEWGEGAYGAEAH